MTDQLPGRTPPWAMGMWVQPLRPQPQPASEPVRIGDAERDEALNRLGDHFVAGRLTREEFDERSETAMGARFDSDLAPLFRDLPKPPEAEVARRPQANGAAVARAGVSATLLLLVPVLVLAVVASIALHGPIFFGPIIWLLVLGHLGRRQRYH
ncbi:protein of unknown function [Microlunatus sagamiharensis]|uniref:DUF1707 domain-containing protein n=1 Tax=Microlunatus sagamiharensis TaxID=546874 RepID=A0A1H2NB41_9ACTN|nr:DUF1707 domain-containing protein [Microlunatus sagamiharensis]SDV02604.1 protein of unknown function [Microlunatus sagamiharensis]